jgi:hypothetical protein
MIITKDDRKKIDDLIEDNAPNINERDRERFREYLELNYMLKECLPPLLFDYPYYLNQALDDYSILAIKKGYSKIFGAKATQYFKNKVLVKRLPNSEIIVYKNPTRERSSYGALIIMIKEFKTPRGLHFRITNEESPDDMVFSSHFIDRFQARLLEVNKIQKTREEAIAVIFDLMTRQSYMHRLMGHNDKVVIDTSLELYMEEGMGLGKTFGKSDGGVINYLRTFIPLDMMHRDQLERHAKAYMTNKNSFKEIKKDF